MKPTNIRVEYLYNPIGLDNCSPRITWIIDDGCINQTSYQIIGTINDKPFDTGIIKENRMYHDFDIPLNQKDIVTFKIRITNEKDEVSELSDNNFFEIGVDTINAKWITGNYKVNKKDRYPVDYFKKEFNSNKVVKARLYASACGIYYAYINNKQVSNQIFNPGFTDYRKHIKLSTFDVTNLIQEGNNNITFELGDGWYRGSIGCKGRRNTYGIQTKLIARLELTYDDGTSDAIITDESFDWSNDGPILLGDLKDGEIVDLNKTPSYSYKAKVIDFKANLANTNNFPVIEHEEFLPIEVTNHEGSKVYHFKQNLAGYFSIKVKGNTNDTIKVVMGELLDDTNHVTLKNIQCLHKGNLTPLQECIITLKEGVNEYKPKFYFGGYRYIEVFGNVEVIELKQIALYQDFKEVSNFDCSNKLITKFVKNTLWSLKSNSIDIPTDCPTRERMGWTGDSQVFFNSAAYLVSYEAFSRKHVRDIFERQKKNGETCQIAPYSSEDWFMAVMNGSVGWADSAVLIPYRYYLIYGDDRLLRKYYQGILKYAHFMISRCGRAKGLYALYSKPLHMSKENKKYQVNTGQSYGEWAEPNDVKAFVWTDFAEPHPEESMAYTYYILDLVLKIEDILKTNDDRELFVEYRDGVKRAYQELVSKDRFTLDTNRQAKLVRPLYMHLLDSKQEEYAKNRLIKALDNYNWRLGTGFLSTPFILDVLKDIDVKYAYKLLYNEKMPGWLYMTINDTGTVWEGWEGPNSQSGIASLNHYSKGAMVEWLFASLLGIKVNGLNHFEIKPTLDDSLEYVNGYYDSIYGKVVVDVAKDKINISIPANTKASFIYKDKEIELVTGNYSFDR